MAAGASFLQEVDTALNEIFSGWGLSTTAIATLLLLFLAYPWLTSKNPDIHPFILNRQATASPVRKSGESAVYRSTEVPSGYPLRSGLNVKDAGSPKWSSGRNGDLRDIWTQAVKGPTQDGGSHDVPKGKFITILGKEQVVERPLQSVNLEVNVIGTHLQTIGGKQVAICLSNSVELLASIFAAVFYGFHPIILPYDSSMDSLTRHLGEVQPDVLIAEAGTLEVDQILSDCRRLSRIILVTEPGNEHMDFTQVSEVVGRQVDVSTWRDLIEQGKSSTSAQLPSLEKDSPSPSITLVDTYGKSTDCVQYTSENVVAAVSALISTLSRTQKIKSDDVVLSVAPLSAQYPLMLTFAALFSNATIAFNSVAGDEVDFELATSTISPTIMIASAKATSRYHDQLVSTQQGFLSKISRRWQNKSLLSGAMPTTPSFAAPGHPDFTTNLRLLSIYHQAEETDLPCLSTTALADLKIALGARTTYALIAPGVAGAVCQTNVFDYRETSPPGSHFGPPLSCLELLLADDEEKVGGIEPEGRIVVRGPVVSGGTDEMKLNRSARIHVDGTVSLL